MQTDDATRSRLEILELRQLVGELQLRNVSLTKQLQDTQQSAAGTAAIVAQLQSERDELRNEMSRLANDLAVMESQHSNLTSLYVAAHQLHGTTDREAVINAIQEIVVNFIGSEEFGVYEGNGKGNLRQIAHVGLRDDVDPSALPGVADAVERGEAFISGNDQSRVAACIPLKFDDKILGCIAIYRLLPHKSSFEPLDLELFDLLKTHAAAALHTASRHEGNGSAQAKS